jgi:hypothetical protein
VGSAHDAQLTIETQNVHERHETPFEGPTCLGSHLSLSKRPEVRSPSSAEIDTSTGFETPR